MHPHTLEGMRSQSRPELIDRQTREVWEQAGATIAHERALAKAKWILENHTPDPLPDDILVNIRAIIDETEKEMGIKKGDNN
jgi:trimethylamine--corrinoid protein Co-methyltransferase